MVGWLKEYHLVAEDYTRRPGNCLFDNVVCQMPNWKVTSQELREETVLFLQKNREKYEQRPDYEEKILRVDDEKSYVTFDNWEEYLDHMNISQVWATELEVEALAAMRQCPIVLIKEGNKPIIYNPDAKKVPIILHLLDNNYFESCVPAKGLKISKIYSRIKELVLT